MSGKDFKQQYPGFTVTCKKCGSKEIELQNDMGWSAMSGGWGGLHFKCTNCDNTTTIHENH